MHCQTLTYRLDGEKGMKDMFSIFYESARKGAERARQDVSEMGLSWALNRAHLMEECTGIDPVFLEAYQLELYLEFGVC